MNIEGKSFKVRVLVVSNHPIFLLGLQDQLKALDPQLNIVGVAHDAASTLERVAELAPEIVLMDLHLHTSSISSIEATSRIKSHFPSAKVIILTADDSVESIISALKAGASGYLLKSVTIVELRDAIYAVLSHGSVLSPSVAQKVLSVMSHPIVKVLTATDREIEILELMALGTSNKGIAKELSLSVRTVEAHVHKVFQKFGVSSRTEAVMAAIRTGIISSPVPDQPA